MEITLVRSAAQPKNPRLVVFKIDGRPGSVQLYRTLFAKDAVPARLTLTGEFAEPKAKETPEERRARLKALPKLTPAERLAKMEERLAKMKARLAAAPTVEQAPIAPKKAAAAPTTKSQVRR